MDFQSISDSVATYIRDWWWGGDPDKVNEISGLTLRDIHAIQKSWAVIHAYPERYGIELFKRLFRADPETKTFFKSFQNMSEQEMTRSYQFKAHVLNFMASINQAVMNLKKPEIVTVMANKLGQSHARWQVQRRHFYVVKDVLVGVLQDLKQTDDVINSWGKFVEFFYQHIFESLGS